MGAKDQLALREVLVRLTFEETCVVFALAPGPFAVLLQRS